MIEKRVARRWSNAVFAMAKENNKIGEWQAQLDLVVSTINDCKELEELLFGKILTAQAKKETLSMIFANNIDKELFCFLELLIDKSREDYLFEIKKSFDELVDEQSGAVYATATSAVQLSNEEEQKLSDALSQLVNGKVRLAVNVNKDIIGGLKVQVGDVVYDGTVQTQLERIRKQLAN